MVASARAAAPRRRLRREASASFLGAPAAAAAARIARGFLDDARRARYRLENPTDAEALHDFRVALRRLRSTLRVYRPWMGGRVVPTKLRRRLKRLARATGTARDAEVGLDWLRRARRRLAPRERIGGDRLCAELKARRDAAYAGVRCDAVVAFDGLDKRLGAALRTHAPATPPLARVLGGLIHERLEALAAELGRVRSVADTEAIHAARVEAKRLRYLFEPLVPELARGRGLVRSLKRFQDEIGAQCDRQTLAAELVAAAGRYGAKRAMRPVEEIMRARSGNAPTAREDDFGPGLRALAARLHFERVRYYRMLERRYFGARADRFLEPYRALAATFDGSAASRR